jgi:transmembrane sensor
MNAAAKEIERCAAEWLERRERGDWNAQKQSELETWQSESVAHRIAFVRLTAAWSRTGRLAALRHGSPERAMVAKKRWRAAVVIAVAAIIVSAAGVASWNTFFGSRQSVYITPVGGHKSIVLADGSRIDLNTDSVLRTRLSAGKSEIWLDRGEAYFQVRHDAAHPFIVMASGHRITDLGTKFLVRRNADGIKVALTEGRLRFESADATVQAHSALLVPGDTAIATRDSIFVEKTSAQTLSAELGWRQGVLVFKFTALSDAAAEFNRYNQKKLVIADAGASRLTIVGTFPTNGVEAFARVAKEVFGLHVENMRDEIVIAR